MNGSNGSNGANGLAFGGPGIAPTWCSSDKDFVTTALGAARLWVTVGHGIVNEIYWPSTGEPQIRDFGFYLVGARRWLDLKRLRRYRLSTPGPYLPLLTIEHYGEDYRLELEVLPDPRRDVLLVRFALTGPYRLVVILAPHLGSSGRDNEAWVEQGVGFARKGDAAVCLAANAPLLKLSCGYVGSSDGWQDMNQHGELTYEFSHADPGTVALSGLVQGTSGVLALGFSESARGARTLVRTAMAMGFDVLRTEFLQAWQAWGERLRLPRPNDALGDAGLLSAAVLKIHEDRSFPGAVVASLSVPWGNSTETLGGYHLVWPRDATLTAFALLAANQISDTRHILAHLIATQLPEGRWPQNYFPSGTPFWSGLQLDETAFPVLLAAKLRELGDDDLPGTTSMIRAAVACIARTGPASDQDRWEENPGVSPFTLAVAISALIAAAPWLTDEERAYADELADDWNERLESWCYVQDTPLARELGIGGYYVRIASLEKTGELSAEVTLRNRDGEQIRAAALLSMDFSYLTRLGLRSSADPRIRDTIAAVDRILRVDTPSGALYHRYNEDGYGEYPDGRAFDGYGVGRAWPLLVGERGHLALQAGEDPLPYLQTMSNCASDGGLLPEQVWDTDAIPALELMPGRPSGSAMPLLWAHAEFLKLLIARERGRPIELLQAVELRYGDGAAHRAEAWHWRDEVPVLHLEAGRGLLVEDRLPFTLHFNVDVEAMQARAAVAQPFGLWSVRLNAAELEGHVKLTFTRQYAEGWEGVNHFVALDRPAILHSLQQSVTIPSRVHP
ncbi:MAG TPA: glycoside hydrolase family 15 protein [Steroidobacteraceae bacterium]|nr:glycoside hydrolase family 15 protein [Steroidobacteraceae bacterium]